MPFHLVCRGLLNNIHTQPQVTGTYTGIPDQSGTIVEGLAFYCSGGVHSLMCPGIVCFRLKGLSKASLHLGGPVDHCLSAGYIQLPRRGPTDLQKSEQETF